MKIGCVTKGCDHLNNELSIVHNSNVSVIQMFAIRIPTVFGIWLFGIRALAVAHYLKCFSFCFFLLYSSSSAPASLTRFFRLRGINRFVPLVIWKSRSTQEMNIQQPSEYQTVWVSRIQMGKSCDVGNHLNTRYLRLKTGFFRPVFRPPFEYQTIWQPGTNLTFEYQTVRYSDG